MAEEKFFSIIIPVYGVEKYLSQCLDSILCQTFIDYEIILVDDGSKDNSPQICDDYARKYDFISVIHKENGGLSSARNAGFAKAQGKYIWFVDSDDYVYSEHNLQSIYNKIQQTSAKIIVLQNTFYDEENKRLTDFSAVSIGDSEEMSFEEIFCELVQRRLYDSCAWNKVFLRELSNDTDLMFEEGIISEDIDWAARLSLATDSVALLDDVAYVYRQGRPGSITSRLSIKNIIDTKGSIERCLNYASLSNKTHSFKHSYYSYVAYRYIIWMAESSAVDDVNVKPMEEEMRQYAWLLNYDLNKKVKLVKYIYKFFGYKITANVLKSYLIHR